MWWHLTSGYHFGQYISRWLQAMWPMWEGLIKWISMSLINDERSSLDNSAVHSSGRTCGYHASVQFSSFAQSCPTLWDPMLQLAWPPWPSPSPGVYPNSYPLSRWCHPTISSSVVSFSSCPRSFPASGSFQMSQFSTSGGLSIGVSASTSVLPRNTQDWSPSRWIGWISF